MLIEKRLKNCAQGNVHENVHENHQNVAGPSAYPVKTSISSFPDGLLERRPRVESSHVKIEIATSVILNFEFDMYIRVL